jgi:hypothetical protein
MIQKQASETFTRARVCWLALALTASGCGVDVPLGDLDAEAPPLDGGESPSAAAPTYDDGIAPRLGVPELTLSMSASLATFQTHDVAVGDLDGDGFDDMAMLGRDAGTGTRFIHLRYGSVRPTDGVGALAFSESGARLVVGVSGVTSGAVGGVYRVGDFDGDGYDDMFVPTWTDDRFEGNGGYLLYGGPQRWAGTHELRTIAAHLDPGPRSNDHGYATYSLAAPGDIDGDGFDDLAMTSPEGSDLAPGVYVFFGRAQRLAAETSWSEATLHVAYQPLLPSAELSTGRDVDGDGVLDLASQAPRQPELSAGGDIDGDGQAELLVTYVDWNGPGGAVDNRIIIIEGSTTRSSATRNLLELESQIVCDDAAPYTDTMMSAQGVGDLDGDGHDDFVLSSWAQNNLLFYGGPQLLSRPLQLSDAAASLPDVALLPVGDRDGDGDDDLIASRYIEDESYVNWPVQRDLLGGNAVATLSGSRVRLSGSVAILPEPSVQDARVFPDQNRLIQAVMSVGDLDDDGASEVVTLSGMVSFLEPDLGPMLHVHYGVHVPPAAPDQPR